MIGRIALVVVPVLVVVYVIVLPVLRWFESAASILQP